MDLCSPIAGEIIATLPRAPAPAPDPHAGEGAGEGEPAPALKYRVWLEPNPTPHATLAVLSGVMSNTAWFRPLAHHWRGMGYRVIGLERRGSGLNYAPDEGCEDTPSADVLIDDALRELEHGHARGRPVVLVGWCWGAILAVHLALRLQEAHKKKPKPSGRGPVAPRGLELSGLALLTPGIHPSVALADHMRALADVAKKLPPALPVLESPITDEMFTSGPALDGFIRRDEARWQRFSPRFLDVSTRMSLAARLRLRKLELPVFAALAEDDVTTDNVAILAELARLPPDRLRTELLPGPHGLQFDAAEDLAERLDAWARDALGV